MDDQSLRNFILKVLSLEKLTLPELIQKVSFCSGYSSRVYISLSYLLIDGLVKEELDRYYAVDELASGATQQNLDKSSFILSSGSDGINNAVCGGTIDRKTKGGAVPREDGSASSCSEIKFGEILSEVKSEVSGNSNGGGTKNNEAIQKIKEDSEKVKSGPEVQKVSSKELQAAIDVLSGPSTSGKALKSRITLKRFCQAHPEFDEAELFSFGSVSAELLPVEPVSAELLPVEPVSAELLPVEPVSAEPHPIVSVSAEPHPAGSILAMEPWCPTQSFSTTGAQSSHSFSTFNPYRRYSTCCIPLDPEFLGTIMTDLQVIRHGQNFITINPKDEVVQVSSFDSFLAKFAPLHAQLKEIGLMPPCKSVDGSTIPGNIESVAENDFGSNSNKPNAVSPVEMPIVQLQSIKETVDSEQNANYSISKMKNLGHPTEAIVVSPDPIGAANPNRSIFIPANLADEQGNQEVCIENVGEANQGLPTSRVSLKRKGSNPGEDKQPKRRR